MSRYITTSPLIVPLLRPTVVREADRLARKAEADVEDELTRAKRLFFERGGTITRLPDQRDRDVEPTLLPF